MVARSIAFLILALTPLYALQTEKSHCQGQEAQLADGPENPVVREHLAECYFEVEIQMGVAGGDVQQIEKRRDEQVLWLIRHKPQDPFLSTPAAAVEPIGNEAASSALKDAWQQQIAEHPTDAGILFNAANSLFMTDFDSAVSLAERAHRLDSSNKEISFRLGQLYGLKMQHAEPAQRTQLAQKALQLSEEALSDATGEARFVQLSNIAVAALEAGDEGKAQKYAEEALTVADQYKTSWNYGNAIHHGNLVIGRIALRHGDIREAKARLLNAGNTPGSPQLNTFGPNMMLAKELLEKNEKEAVLQYFTECGKFWEMGGETLLHWQAAVRQDRIPDFGPNLQY